MWITLRDAVAVLEAQLMLCNVLLRRTQWYISIATQMLIAIGASTEYSLEGTYCATRESPLVGTNSRFPVIPSTFSCLLSTQCE
jgi:hypothetical protein